MELCVHNARFYKVVYQCF